MVGGEGEAAGTEAGRGGRLGPEARAALLRIARRALEHGLRGAALVLDDLIVDPVLLEPRGAFVTLKKRGALRGCIGYVEPVRPLAETVARCAVAAATEDFRFPPVRPEALGEIAVSISVLGPLRRLGSVDELAPGRHGLLVVRGPRRGLLLPQVAAEYGWDRPTFLAETCLKAGLPPDAWRAPETELFVFETENFAEAGPPAS